MAINRFNAKQFRNSLKGDVARPNLFQCTVKFPSKNGGIASGADENFSFVCRSAQIPLSQLGQIQVPYFGRMVKFAGDRQFDDFPVRVINDEKHNIRDAFERWQNILDIINHDSDRKELINPADRTGTQTERTDAYPNVFVTHISKGGIPLRTYQMHSAFPFVIEPVQLDWQENDTAMEFGVVFAYDYFTVHGEGEEATSINDSDKGILPSA